jgi:hypothetical protein
MSITQSLCAQKPQTSPVVPDQWAHVEWQKQVGSLCAIHAFYACAVHNKNNLAAAPVSLGFCVFLTQAILAILTEVDQDQVQQHELALQHRGSRVSDVDAVLSNIGTYI